ENTLSARAAHGLPPFGVSQTGCPAYPRPPGPLMRIVGSPTPFRQGKCCRGVRRRIFSVTGFPSVAFSRHVRSGSVRRQAEDGDLGGAVVAEGLARAPDATIDIDMGAPIMVPAGDLIAAQVELDDQARAEQGQGDLPAMGMAGEHEQVAVDLLDQAGIVRED